MRGFWTVYEKEVREMLRDKRVRSAIFAGPLLTIFVMIGLLGIIVSSVGKKENFQIYTIGKNNPMAESLRKSQLTVLEVANKAEGDKLILSGKAKVVLEFPDNPVPGAPMKITASYDPKSSPSEIAISAVEKAFAQAGKEALKVVLLSKGVPAEMAEPIQITRRQVTEAKSDTPEFLVGIIPYLIVLWAFYGAMGMAGDLVAGEKEKFTLETLLVSPIRRTDVAVGKLMTLATASFISCCSSLFGLFLITIIKLPGTELILQQGFSLSPLACIYIFAALIPLIMLSASVLLAVSTYSRNTREAQTLLATVGIIFITPAIFSQTLQFNELGREAWLYTIPVLNTASIIREALLGKFNFLNLSITIAVTSFIAIILIAFAVRYFKKEAVLART